MANISIKIQGFDSWGEGKFSVELEDLNKLVLNSDETYPEAKKYQYYSEQEIKCWITIPWEILSLFYDLDTNVKLDKVKEESDASIASKISNSAFGGEIIPRLFDDKTLEIFPYWMYKYIHGGEKTGRSLMERNENTINPLLLSLFLKSVSEKIIPLNIFSKQEKVISFIKRANEFCSFAQKYHIRVSFDTNM